MGTLLGMELKSRFDVEDQKHVVYAALRGFHSFNKPGQVNVLDVDWADTVNDVFEVGNSRAAIRPKRVTKRVYQSEEDMALAIGHYGQDAEGIVSPEAIRQYKYYNQARM